MKRIAALLMISLLLLNSCGTAQREQADGVYNPLRPLLLNDESTDPFTETHRIELPFSGSSDEYVRRGSEAFSDQETSEIRSMLWRSICGYIDVCKLDCSDKPDSDALVMFWEQDGGQLLARAEWIADVTSWTTREFGCINHAHIYGRVTVSFSGDRMVLTGSVGGS